MQFAAFRPVTGIIQRVSPIPNQCCNLMVSLLTSNGPVNLVVTPDTYIIDQVRLRPGMRVTGFYDANAPAILIFPPQYTASVLLLTPNRLSVTVAYFNQNLTAEDNSLQLNLSPNTEILMSNGQRYTCSPANNVLVVYYGPTTRSIPPQTTPEKIIVLC